VLASVPVGAWCTCSCCAVLLSLVSLVAADAGDQIVALSRW